MLKKIFATACTLFTVTVTLYSLLILLIYSADPESSLAISAVRVFLFFPFAFVLSAANRLFDIKAMDKWLQTVLHFIIYMLDVYLCLILPMGVRMTPTFMLVGLSLFFVLYAATFAVLALIRAKTARAENAEKEYTPVYRKSMDKK